MDDDTFLSPRLQNLYSAIQKGDTKALSTFWNEILLSGTPLIEDINNPTHDLVTFLYREENEVNDIILFFRPISYDPTQMRFKHLPKTDVYYLSYKILKKARATYGIIRGKPYYTEDYRKNLQFFSKTKPDPLNEKIFYFYKDSEDSSKDMARSILEMPGAHDYPWFYTKVPDSEGKVDSLEYHNNEFPNPRKIWVYTPPEYNKNQKYPAIFLFDGNGYLEYINVPKILNNLIQAKKIPPVICVFIQSIDRIAELLTNDPKFGRFIAQGLHPWLAKQYSLSANSPDNILGGVSAGGLAAAFIALEHANIFGKVLSQSGAFPWKPSEDEEYEWIIREYVKKPKENIEFYLEIGKLESFSPMGKDYPNVRYSQRHMRDVLLAKGYRVHYHEFIGGHDYICWKETFGDALIKLLGLEK